MPLKSIIFQTSMFWSHVSFRGCSSMAFFFPVKHGFHRQLKMLQEFQLRSCSTRTNVVRFLSGTWFVGVLRFWHQQKRGLEVEVSNIVRDCSYVSSSPLVGQILKFIIVFFFFSSGLSTNGLNKLLFSPKEMGMFPKTICQAKQRPRIHALHCGSFNCGIDLRQPGKYATLLKHIVKAVSSP